MSVQTKPGEYKGQVRFVDKWRDEYVGTPDERRTLTDRIVTVWTGSEWVDVRELIAAWNAR